MDLLKSANTLIVRLLTSRMRRKWDYFEATKFVLFVMAIMEFKYRLTFFFFVVLRKAALLSYIPSPYYFETQSCSIAQAGLELVIFLPRPPEQLMLQGRAITPWYKIMFKIGSIISTLVF